MRVVFVAVLIATLAAAPTGCTSAPPSTAVSPEDVRALTGSWQGWLVTEGNFSLVTVDIREDGSFEVRAPLIHATGLLVTGDGRLRFDGTGAWRGTLVPEGSGTRRTLRIERDDRLYRGTLRPVSPS